MYCPPERGDIAYGPVMAQGAVENGFDTIKNADSYAMYVMNIWMGSIFGLPQAKGQ
ncbi:hypothetical protein CERZMDRAFT_89985 [Cercospora zeae-maydis SCOH1-5]|uniref:Uncharacterized protein n=1 Tax=Cercospora zeae-maydis SCOH1-5 TaxID=717836 RepID=A0A6A6FQL4_9PEZI|nr:hypothetical protein CERZMDRAFT_89985 [Cercospora zeae-maydis SCOH1-5]